MRLVSAKFFMQLYKNKFLGMPYGTATSKLRKQIMFHLVKQLNQQWCFRCSQEIKNENDFSIDHKLAWQDEDINLFWNLNNIAFSHLSCNKKASRYRTEPRRLAALAKRAKITGQAKCCVCKQLKDVLHFSLNKTKPRGIQTECRECRSKQRKHGK